MARIDFCQFRQGMSKSDSRQGCLARSQNPRASDNAHYNLTVKRWIQSNDSNNLFGKMAGRHMNMSQDSLQESRADGAHSGVKERSCVPSFISKTYEILEKEEHSELISWSDNGMSFYVKNIKQFEENILPIYFRHKNFASFVRQLNMYDFHKVRGEQKHIFSHKLFQRHQKHLLQEIKRKCFKKQRETSQDDRPEQTPEEPVEPVPVKRTPVKQPTRPTEESTRRKRSHTARLQQSRRTLEIIQKENQKSRERNLQLMNEIILRLKKLQPQSDREIREKINELKSNPKYEHIMGKNYIYEIYKRLREGMYEQRPRNTLEDLDELSIEEEIIYNEIERSKFKIASLTNFQTENFMLRSGREVINTMTGEEHSRDFF